LKGWVRIARVIALGVFAFAILLTTATARTSTSAVWKGDFAGDTSNVSSLIFSATGKLNKKGKFVTKRVDHFDVAVQFSCFDAAGNVTSTSRRDDLPPGETIGGEGLKVSNRGRFAGTAGTTIIGGPDYTATGLLRKGKGSGTMQITQGQKGTAGYCSTGTFADPTLAWKAKLTHKGGGGPTCIGCGGGNLGPNGLR